MRPCVCIPQIGADDLVGLWKSDGNELLELKRDGQQITGSLKLKPDAKPISIRGRVADGQFIFEYTRSVTLKGKTTEESGSGFLKLADRPTRMIGGFGAFKDAHKVKDVWSADGDWSYLEVDRCLSRETLRQLVEDLVSEELDFLRPTLELTDIERDAAQQSVRDLVKASAASLFAEHAVGIWRTPSDVHEALHANYSKFLTPAHFEKYEADQALRQRILHRAFVVVTLMGLDMNLALDATQYDRVHEWLSSEEMISFRVPKNASGLLMRSGLPEKRLRDILTESQLKAYADRRTTFRKDVYRWPKRSEEDALVGLEESIDRAFELQIQAWQRDYSIGEEELKRLPVLKRRVTKRLREQRLLANKRIERARDLTTFAQNSAFILIPMLDAGVLMSADSVWGRFRTGIIKKSERSRYSNDLRRRMKLSHEFDILQLVLELDNGGRHPLTGEQLQKLVELFGEAVRPDAFRKLAHLDWSLTLARIPTETIIGEERWANRRFWIQNSGRIAKSLEYSGGLQADGKSDTRD